MEIGVTLVQDGALYLESGAMGWVLTLLVTSRVALAKPSCLPEAGAGLGQL